MGSGRCDDRVARVVGSDELNCGSCFEFASMSKRIEGAGKIGSKSKRPFRSWPHWNQAEHGSKNKCQCC